MIEEILSFWFVELESKQWWMKDEKLDGEICSRFSRIHEQASRCELFSWRGTARGRLAEILVLDQFSRNIHRGSPRAFSSDALALGLAQEAIERKVDQQLEAVERLFIYMPFMHSESQIIHEIAVGLFEGNGLPTNLEFELKHKHIIDRFGRYPHRNDILGRISTKEEVAFLKEPYSSF